MRIGLSAGGAFERVVEQVKEAEAEGFAAMWFAGAVTFDPLIAIAVAGRATERIELGTSVVQTYPKHPIAMAQEAAAVQSALGDAGAGRFTLGIGVSHEPAVQGMLKVPYDRPGRNLREYLDILVPLLRGEQVNVKGDFWSATAAMANAPSPAPSVLVAALGPVMLQAAGSRADGTILWMGNARAIETHVAPTIAAAANGGSPRIVAGLPVAVCDDEAEGRAEAAKQFAGYGMLPNYQRILAHGGIESPGDAAIVGDEASVTKQLQGLLDAGATDVWAAIFPVGGDRRASRQRTRDLLRTLL